MSHDTLYDVVVIGGGLAGAANGIHLAKLGYGVAILEREPKAHHKVCGEFLSPETLPYLAEIDIDVDQLGASTLSGFSLHAHHLNSRHVFDTAARGLSRFVLDEACLKSAIQSGCHVFRNSEVKGFVEVKDQPSQKFFEIQTSQGNFKGKTLFLATGKSELRHIAHRKGLEHMALGMKMHYQISNSQISTNDVEMYFFKNGYGGLCQIENGIFNFCFIINQSQFKALGSSYDLVLSNFQKQSKKLARTLKDAKPLWSKPLSIAAVPYGHVLHTSDLKKLPNNIYPIGDQFAVIPSLTGSGMAIALHTAHIAADQFHKHPHSTQNEGVLKFIQTCTSTITNSMRLAYPFHTLTRSPILADAAVGICKLLPSLPHSFVNRTRIPSLIQT